MHADKACWVQLKDGSLDETSIMYILHEVVGALLYLHGESRMHRDVKAANILLSASGDVKMSGTCPLTHEGRLISLNFACLRWVLTGLVQHWSRQVQTSGPPSGASSGGSCRLPHASPCIDNLHSSSFL